MLKNRKETFRLLDELIGGGDRIIVEVTGKDLEQVNWLANIAVNHLNSLEEDAEYIEYSEGLQSNLFSYEYELEDGCGEYLDFMLFNEWDTCTKPYYSMCIRTYGDEIDEDNMVTYHKIYRRNGKDGKWKEWYTYNLTQTGSAEKCAKCPRREICFGDF